MVSLKNEVRKVAWHPLLGRPVGQGQAADRNHSKKIEAQTTQKWQLDLDQIIALGLLLGAPES